MRRRILTIAGSDPSGGAGIQSDLRTFATLGAIGLSAVTALTVQNTLGVFGVFPVDPSILSAQVDRVLEDGRVDAIKIGMLGGSGQVGALLNILEKRRPQNVVIDPVLASTGGVPLLDTAGRSLLLSSVLPYCSLITPNIDEAAQLTGINVTDKNSIINAGTKLLSLGAQAVLVKGGHLDSAPADWLIQRECDPIEFPGTRVETMHTHGTGCLLSSAIAVGLANGLTMEAAVRTAKSAVETALRYPIVAGRGRGYPDVFAAMSNGRVDPHSHSDRLAKLKGLYVVTDPKLQGGRTNEEIARHSLAGGAGIFQLRDKMMPLPELVKEAKRLSAIIHGQDKLFIVNDRVDVALASGADGVHLGPDDMSPADVRAILGPDNLIGVSTGTVEEAVVAAPYASYFGIGAIFGSTTKADAGSPVTPERIREIKARFPTIPVVAIGGINESNIREVIAAGADSVAVISAVVGKNDVEQAASSLASVLARIAASAPTADFSRAGPGE